jgi:hypothetical protein
MSDEIKVGQVYECRFGNGRYRVTGPEFPGERDRWWVEWFSEGPTPAPWFRVGLRESYNETTLLHDKLVEDAPDPRHAALANGTAGEIVGYSFAGGEVTATLPRKSEESRSMTSAPVRDMKAGLRGGKPQLSLNPRAALVHLARVLEYGAAKYERGNYHRGTPEGSTDWERAAGYLDALLRHTTRVADEVNRLRGTDGDPREAFKVRDTHHDGKFPPSFLPDVAHALASAALLTTVLVDLGVLGDDIGTPWKKLLEAEWEPTWDDAKCEDVLTRVTIMHKAREAIRAIGYAAPAKPLDAVSTLKFPATPEEAQALVERFREKFPEIAKACDVLKAKVDTITDEQPRPRPGERWRSRKGIGPAETIVHVNVTDVFSHVVKGDAWTDQNPNVYTGVWHSWSAGHRGANAGDAVTAFVELFEKVEA